MSEVNSAAQKPSDSLSTTDLWQNLVAVLEEKLEVDAAQLRPEARFIDDLGADSLDMIELLLELEDQFKLTIPHAVAGQLKTVGEAFEYLRERIA